MPKAVGQVTPNCCRFAFTTSLPKPDVASQRVGNVHHRQHDGIYKRIAKALPDTDTHSIPAAGNRQLRAFPTLGHYFEMDVCKQTVLPFAEIARAWRDNIGPKWPATTRWRSAILQRVCTAMLAAASFSLAGCQPSDYFGETLPTYRYRLTVAFNTPEGIKSSSSVIQVETSRSGKYNLDAEYLTHRKVRGDAVVVDLGRRGRVFVILKDYYDQTWPSEIMLKLIKPVSGVPMQDIDRIQVERILALSHPIALHAHIDDKRYPLADGLPDFVTFANPSDLTTAKIVQPNGLATAFGAGVTLRSMTVQITSDPVTRSAVHSLKWLSDEGAYQRNNRRPPDSTSAAAFSSIDFTRNM